MFDAIAPRYDFLNHVLSAGIDHLWRRRAIRSLGLTGRERVLDVCTGTADLAIEARRASPGAAKVVGVDFAGAMLVVARDKLKRAGLAKDVTLVRGDATRPPPALAACDLVFLDPPYRSGLAAPALSALAEAGWIAAGAVATVELAHNEDLAAPSGFVQIDERRYGAAKILILRKAS